MQNLWVDSFVIDRVHSVAHSEPLGNDTERQLQESKLAEAREQLDVFADGITGSTRNYGKPGI